MVGWLFAVRLCDLQMADAHIAGCTLNTIAEIIAISDVDGAEGRWSDTTFIS